MTSVDIATGEIVDFDPAAAERRAERIVTRLDAIAENFTRVLPMIREAIEKRDDLALGYRSPGEYVADRFGQSLGSLGFEVRRAVVGELTAAGLSTRAIAPIVDVSQKTVDRDIRALSIESHDSVGPECDRPAPTPITGINGKRYERPIPKPSIAPTVDDAVREFPDLAHYAETDPRRALLMADDLRRYRELGELDIRLDNLRRSIAVDKAKRDGTDRPGTTAVMGEDGVYRMEPMPVPITTTRTCPACNGQGVIKEQS